MKKHTLICAAAAALTAGSAQVYAAGFQLAETSATGLGRAFAGEAAIADNASAQFRNPALLSDLPGLQMSAGAIKVMPHIDITGQTRIQHMYGLTHQVTTYDTKATDIAKSALIPNAYLSYQINPHWSTGLALSAGYGMSSKLEDSFRGTQFGNEASIKAIEINPNIAYRFNDSISVGFGLRYVMADADISATSSAPLQLFPQSVPKGTMLKYMAGDDTAWAWQAGALWHASQATTIGLSYRSEVDLKLQGHAYGLGFNPLKPEQHYPGTMALTLPATAELAAKHQLTERLALHASVNWTDWSKFTQLRAEIPGVPENAWLVKEENWHDSYRAAVGSTYQVSNRSVIRGGIAFDKSSVDDATRTLTIPEMNRYWASLGYGYQVSKHMTVDISMAYLLAQQSRVSEPRQGARSDKVAAMFGGEFSGTTQGDVWLMGVQLSYRF